MRLARMLYERFTQLIHEVAKFGVVGVIGLLITNGAFDVLRFEVGLGPITSTAIATVVATAVAFIGNRYWTFRHRERTGVGREGALFFVLNGIGLLITVAAVGFNSYVLGLPHNKVAGFVALNLGIGVATLFRFWSYRKWVWLMPAQATAQQAGPVPRPAASAVPGAATNGRANGQAVRVPVGDLFSAPPGEGDLAERGAPGRFRSG